MRHFNPSIAEDQTRILNLKGQENVSEVADLIQPTIEIKPNLNIVRNSDGTIYTTPSDKDFYLTAAEIATAHAATDTGTDANILATIQGSANQRLVVIKELNNPGVPSTQTAIMYFNPPLKIDRGTAIIISATNFTGARGCINGYTRETIKGV